MAGPISQLDGTCNCTALRKASRYLTAAYDQALSPVGLRATQFTILQKSASNAGVSVTDLAEIMAMDRTTMAKNLKPLVRSGLLTVDSPTTDRRRRIVNITADGVAKFEQALPLWTAAQAKFESNFGIEKAAELRRLLGSVLQAGFDPWAE